MEIKQATEQDIPAIISLIKQLVDYHCEIDPYYRPFSEIVGLKKYILESINDDKANILIAEENNKMIGYIIGAISKAPNYTIADMVGNVDDIFVEEKYRNLQIGEKMFSEMLKWFKDKKIEHIELSVDARNEVGIKAWKKYGFSDFRIKMRLDI